MATPERATESSRLQRAALAERARLARELNKTDRRITALGRDLVRAESVRAELQDRLELLARLTGVPDLAAGQHLALIVEPKADQERDEGTVLRGATIRTVAVRVLASCADPFAPVHYTAWLDLVRQAGYTIGGLDPSATFLTQISRSPVVSRRSEPGTYGLDLDAPQHLEQRLTELRQELTALHEGQQTIEGIASARERRNQLSAELSRVERLLVEAVDSLGLEHG